MKICELFEVIANRYSFFMKKNVCLHLSKSSIQTPVPHTITDITRTPVHTAQCACRYTPTCGNSCVEFN